jgi:hypothetical protein
LAALNEDDIYVVAGELAARDHSDHAQYLAEARSERLASNR